MADTCTRCSRPIYPDSGRYCRDCRPLRSDRWMAEDAMLPLAIEAQRPQECDDAPLVGTDRMSVRETVVCGLIALAVMLLFGWLLGEAVQR